MTAVKIAALLVAAAVLCVAIRVNRPELAMAVGLLAGLTACLLSMDELAGAVRILKEWLTKAGADDGDTALLLRLCGLSLIGEYAAQLCRDAGEGALAQRVEFGTRVSLTALLTPLAAEVLSAAVALLP